MKLKYGELDTLEKELEKLSPLHRIAFAAACCERLYPNYGIIVREMKQMLPDEPNHLRTALDKIWEYLAERNIDATTFRQLISDCEGYHYYEEIYNAEAQRTLEAIICALELCLEPTARNAIAVLRQIDETLFEYLDGEMDNKDPNWNKKSHFEVLNIISNHPFTIREMNQQTEDLKKLKEISSFNREFLNLLRNSSNNQGKSLLDLS
ncbi:MAG: DUF416 family protein [Pleurocapsa sp.]